MAEVLIVFGSIVAVTALASATPALLSSAKKRARRRRARKRERKLFRLLEREAKAGDGSAPFDYDASYFYCLSQ